MNSKKRMVGLLAATLLGSACATAMAQGYGMGPGMMGGGSGYGMGPGMMGGGGPGYGMGPGMMGDGGYRHGYGPGMMGGGGPGYGMGQGMMWGHGGYWPSDLTDQQRGRINKIQDDFRKKQWELAGKLQDEYPKLRDLYQADKLDPAAIGNQYKKIFDLRRQMIELTVDMHNRVDDVLTKEQREAQRKQERGWMMWN